MDKTDYKYTEEDVEAALRFLRLNFPSYATPENAIKVLVYTREHTVKLEELSTEDVEKTLQDLEDH